MILNTPNQTRNRVPEFTEDALDIRFPAPHTTDDLLAIIREALPSTIELSVELSAVPTEMSPPPQFFEIARQVTGRTYRDCREDGGSAVPLHLLPRHSDDHGPAAGRQSACGGRVDRYRFDGRVLSRVRSVSGQAVEGVTAAVALRAIAAKGVTEG